MARKRAAGAVAPGLVSLEDVRKFAFSAVAREDTRPVLTCGYTDGAAVASADGFRLHVASFADDAARRMLVPEDGLIGLTDESRAVAADGGHYPDFAAIIPRWRESGYLRLRVHRHDLRSLVGIAEVFARDNNFSTRLSFNPDHVQLAVYARSPERGDSCSVLDVELEGGSAWSVGVEVAINARYLLDTLAGMRSDYITLAISDPNKPIVLSDPVQTEAGPVDLFSLIMPMSVNGPAGDSANVAMLAPWGERMHGDHFPLKRNPTAIANRKPKTQLQDTFYDSRCDISALWPATGDYSDEDSAQKTRANAERQYADRSWILVESVSSDTDEDTRADYDYGARAYAYGLVYGRLSAAQDIAQDRALNASRIARAAAFSEAHAVASRDNATDDGARVIPAPAPVIAPRRRIVWRKRSARMIGAHDRRARYTPPPVTPLEDKPADVCPAAQSINAPTFDVSSAINALTLDDLAGLMAARIASAALAQVNSALDSRMRQIGREMQAARVWCIASIEQAQVGPVMVGVDDLPLVCEWDKPADGCDNPINAPTFGPDWSVWGEFWEIPPSPDLEDTQPMPAVTEDEGPGPDDDPPAPSGGGSDVQSSPLNTVGVTIRPESDPYGKPAWYAYRTADGIPLYLGGRSPEAVIARLGTGYGTITIEQPPTEAPTKIALRNAKESEGVGGLEDKPADVYPEPEPVNLPTFDTSAAVADHLKAFRHWTRLELERSMLERQPDSPGVVARMNALKAEIEAVNLRQIHTLGALHEGAPELAEAVEDYCRLHARFEAIMRECLAWIDHLGTVREADAKHAYGELARSLRELEAAWQHERGPARELESFGVRSGDTNGHLITVMERAIAARKDAQKRLGIRIKPDPIEKYV